MAEILNIYEMTEEDIKLRYITPALTKSWNPNRITMETKITDGKIEIAGNMVKRKEAKKADYVLYINANNPIAIVEAKKYSCGIDGGIQQAIEYAKMMDVPFAYSSNGDGFREHDFLTGQERNLQMDEFPTPEELLERFKKAKNITEREITAINQPYYSSQNSFPPRYYQRIAVNRTLDAMAKGQNRILLALATGTGKTYIAFQIAYRALQCGLAHKVLYLADRNNLVDQSISQDFAPLEKFIHKVDASRDNKTTITSYEIYFCLYQQLVGEDDTEHYSELFSPGFFDLIIVDECHRGSAKEDSRWRKILEYFQGATQIGMTATPKETKYISTISYFGDPLYSYSLNQGIEDGFLAPFRIIKLTTNIGEGWRPLKGQRDKCGNLIEDRIYNNSDYDYNIILEDRTREVAAEITNYLKATDRMAKTIVFCPTEEAALRMRDMLVELNSDMVKENADYIVRITGSDEYGKGKLKHFISATQPYPVIATTSKLLSTGSDCKMVKLIVLDEMIGSMTEFKQIIGRGTRIREKEGKTHFAVMDFRNVSALFNDPDWDGPIEVDDGFTPGGGGKKPPKPPVDKPDPVVKPIVDRNGCRVEIIYKTVSLYDTNGKLLKQESITDYTRENLQGEYATLDAFIEEWRSDPDKTKIRDMLSERGIDLEKMKAEQQMQGVDDFDFLCHVAYDKKPLTRKERAANVRKRDFLSKYSGAAREVLEALLDKYADSSIYEISKTEVLRLDPFAAMGKPAKIAGFFGGREGYLKAVQELENEIYFDEAV